jgi:thymidylate synthase ThyX
MSPNRQIYLLDPKKLSQETIAVTFAKTSRSPQTFQEIADELSDEKSADFSEKWIVGYGHSSVAEHAVLHIAIENVSRLAVECIESNRLASYTEKSSRYQIWGLDHFYTPAEFVGTPAEGLYTNTCQRLFTNYEKAVACVKEYLEKTQPQKENESAGMYKMRIRNHSADVCRYYLPACSLANLGMTINARALEHALCKMLSHPLEEVRRIGTEIKQVSQENVPTLVKYANRNECDVQVRQNFTDFINIWNLPAETSNDWLNMACPDTQGEERILAALLVRFGECSFNEALKIVHQMPQAEKEKLAKTFLGALGEHDIPLRELEYANITADIVLDQGAYFELKRHRMMTQTPQRFTSHLGYAIPRLITDAGIMEEYIADMEEVERVYEKLNAVDPEAAAYILPNAFNRRVLLECNLRSAYHFIKLRSASNAHFAIRRVAQRLSDEVQARFPLFADYFRPDSQETCASITAAYFVEHKF